MASAGVIQHTPSSIGYPESRTAGSSSNASGVRARLKRGIDGGDTDSAGREEATRRLPRVYCKVGIATGIEPRRKLQAVSFRACGRIEGIYGSIRADVHLCVALIGSCPATWSGLRGTGPNRFFRPRSPAPCELWEGVKVLAFFLHRLLVALWGGRRDKSNSSFSDSGKHAAERGIFGKY